MFSIGLPDPVQAPSPRSQQTAKTARKPHNGNFYLGVNIPFKNDSIVIKIYELCPVAVLLFCKWEKLRLSSQTMPKIIPIQSIKACSRWLLDNRPFNISVLTYERGWS